MNFHDSAFLNPPDTLCAMAELIKESGARPELECFDLGHVRLANWLIDQGYIEGIPLYQICLGVPWGRRRTPSQCSLCVIYCLLMLHGLRLAYRDCRWLWRRNR